MHRDNIFRPTSAIKRAHDPNSKFTAQFRAAYPAVVARILVQDAVMAFAWSTRLEVSRIRCGTVSPLRCNERLCLWKTKPVHFLHLLLELLDSVGSTRKGPACSSGECILSEKAHVLTAFLTLN